MDPTTPNIATTIAELARQASATKSLGSDIVALPTAKGDFQIHNLEIYQPHPAGIRQIVKIATLADHVDYVIRQRAAGSNTVLFANRKALKEKLKGHATIYEGEEPAEPGLVTSRL